MSEPLDRAEEAQATGPRPNRIFVGLKMAPETAVSLAALAERIDSVPLRRVAPNDIHLTLVPPWDETSIPAAVRRLSKGVTGFERFPLSFERLCYWPERRRPRLVWAECAACPELEALQGVLLEPPPWHARLSGCCFVIARCTEWQQALICSKVCPYRRRTMLPSHAREHEGGNLSRRHSA